jgi:hypothetical protein
VMALAEHFDTSRTALAGQRCRFYSTSKRTVPEKGTGTFCSADSAK